VLLQVASIAGAFLILAAYAAHQAGRMSRTHVAYHAINAAGGALLLAAAVATWQIGFIILEGAWTIISLVALFHPGSRRPATRTRESAADVLE
jgi:hypothetical protein